MKDINFNIAFTSDMLIFGIDSRRDKNARALPQKYLSILLVKRSHEPFKNKWCLPGGFIGEEESSFDASLRVLKKETGLENVYMQKLSVNDEIKRDPRGRVISISYMALIDKTLLKESLNQDACWFDILLEENNNFIKVNLTNNIEDLCYNVEKVEIDKKSNEYNYKTKNNVLAFDHEEIIANGIMELKNKVNTTDIVFNLMPEYFTIGELKQVYEILLNKKFINSAFRRTIADKVELTKEMIKTGGHRPSILCKYKGKN